MEHVSDTQRNPFGMRAPVLDPDAPREAVYGYGDPAADFHVIGHYPGVHGGLESGLPFGDTDAGRRLHSVLVDVGLLEDVDGPDLVARNAYLSYLHASATPEGRWPTDTEHERLERYFDAELRAVNAHVLLPVGRHAIDHVLTHYTTQRAKFDDLDALHATEIRGRGFLVVPVREPAEWTDADEDALRQTLAALLASDYRQTKGVATLVG